MLNTEIIEYINSLNKNDTVRLFLILNEKNEHIRNTTKNYAAIVWSIKNPELRKEINVNAKRKQYAKQKALKKQKEEQTESMTQPVLIN